MSQFPPPRMGFYPPGQQYNVPGGFQPPHPPPGHPNSAMTMQPFMPPGAGHMQHVPMQTQGVPMPMAMQSRLPMMTQPPPQPPQHPQAGQQAMPMSHPPPPSHMPMSVPSQAYGSMMNNAHHFPPQQQQQQHHQFPAQLPNNMHHFQPPPPPPQHHHQPFPAQIPHHMTYGTPVRPPFGLIMQPPPPPIDNAPPPPPPEPMRPPEPATAARVLLYNEGRLKRPRKMVWVMRGLPGSGKSYFAQIIKKIETDQGASAPRILAIDDYFLTETERIEEDPDTKRKRKVKASVYEYDPEMEPAYRASLVKTFSKTLADGFFNFVIVDDTNPKVADFKEYKRLSMLHGFQFYLIELENDIQKCLEQNIHNRTEDELKAIKDSWEWAPPLVDRLHVKGLENGSDEIDEVEMVDESEDSAFASGNLDVSRWDEDDEKDVPISSTVAKLKSSIDAAEARRKHGWSDESSNKRTAIDEDIREDMDDGLPKRKRVRFADEVLQERGFTIGQARDGHSALHKIHVFEKGQ